MTQEDIDNKLKELVTPEFLSTLTEVSKLYGWSGDFIEIFNFVEDLHSIKGIKIDSYEPYETTD